MSVALEKYCKFPLVTLPIINCKLPRIQWSHGFSRSIFRPANHRTSNTSQLEDVSHPTDSPTATKLGLCSSLFDESGESHRGNHYMCCWNEKASMEKLVSETNCIYSRVFMESKNQNIKLLNKRICLCFLARSINISFCSTFCAIMDQLSPQCLRKGKKKCPSWCNKMSSLSWWLLFSYSVPSHYVNRKRLNQSLGTKMCYT